MNKAQGKYLQYKLLLTKHNKMSMPWEVFNYDKVLGSLRTHLSTALPTVS